MQTLTYGYIKPQSGDRGSALFNALESNIQKVNDHKHDGLDSSPISTKSILAETQALSSSNWVAYGAAGFFRQLVTLPTGFLFDSIQMGFRVGGNVAFLDVERVDNFSYYVYSNDSTISPTVLYGG